MTLKHSRSVHHSPVWRSPLIPIVVEQTVSVASLTAAMCVLSLTDVSPTGILTEWSWFKNGHSERRGDDVSVFASNKHKIDECGFRVRKKREE